MENLRSKLEQWAEREAVKYCDKPRCATITRSCKTWHRMKSAHMDASFQLIPMVEKLAIALTKYKTQSCSMQNLDMAAKEALVELEEFLGEQNGK